MAEGKTLGTPGVKCECCEEADSSHFCCDCNQPLCTRCTKQHGRIASTKLHKLIPIEQYKSLASTTTTTDSSKAYCAKHPSKTIEKLCEDCLVVVCSVCEPGHRGHRITHGSLDANILQRVSAQKIPGLVEIIQELRDLNDGSPEKIKLYKEAEKLVKSWKNELLDLLNRDADCLLKEIQGEITKQETISAEMSSKIQECIVKTEQQMSKLSEALKISSPTKLLDRMSKCDTDIEDVKMYLAKMKASQEKLKIGDILPYKDELGKTKRLMRTLFTKSKGQLAGSVGNVSILAGAGRKQGRIKPRLYDKLRLAAEAPLTGISYCRICASHVNDPHQMCIFDANVNKVQVFDMNLQETASYTCSKRIHDMVAIAPNRYVIAEVSPNNVYLADERFVIIRTIITPTDEYKPRGLCLIDANVIIISEENKKNHSTHFKKIRFNGNRVDITTLCEVNTLNLNGLMTYQDSGHLIYSDTIKSLRSVDLDTGKSTSVCSTNAGITGITSLSSDGNVILIGDVYGNIYKMDDGKNLVRIRKESSLVTVLLPTDTGLVVATETNLRYYDFK